MTIVHIECVRDHYKKNYL